MNVFENLVDELKNENLLEETVIDLDQADAAVLVSEEPSSARLKGGGSFQGQDATGEAVLQMEDEPAGMGETDQEFFRKRAVEEVTGLQMVDHMFSGVEREHMKVSPSPY